MPGYTTPYQQPSYRFPFLFGGTFIEVLDRFWENQLKGGKFPFLFGGTFIEVEMVRAFLSRRGEFPFLFGGTFIEVYISYMGAAQSPRISLPFRRDFH